MNPNLDLIKGVADALGWPVLTEWPLKSGGQFPSIIIGKYSSSAALKFKDWLINRAWDPTTNLHDAMDALEDFTEKYRGDYAIVKSITEDGVFYSVSIYVGKNWEIRSFKRNKSKSLAICKAITKAITQVKRVIDERGGHEIICQPEREE